MSIVLDLIVIAIITLCVLISAKRGFMKCLVETVGFVAAIVIAFTVSSPLADLAYDKIIEPPVVKAAVNSLEKGAEDEIQNALPEIVVNKESSVFSFVVPEDFARSIKDNLSLGTETAVKTASQNIVRPIATKILGLLFAVILILVLSVLVKFLAKILNKVFSFSVIGKLNRTLGGVIGGVKGIAFAMIFCMVVSLILSVTGKSFLIFSNENIENSYLFKFLTDIVPFN